MKRRLILTLAAGVLTILLMGQGVLAQHTHTEPQCDVESVIAHQQEHAQELVNFAAEAETDLDAALAKLYRTAVAYQALAAECGFDDAAAVEAEHEAEHAAAEVESQDILALANSIGDPEAGKELFNTFRAEVSFACATCHRVDSTEVLVGPGLLGVGSPTHDHSAHSDTTMEMNMPMPEATTAVDHGHSMEATPEADHDHSADAAPEAEAERTLDQIVTYLHTSIVDPSAYVVPGSPDNLMPKVYGEILTEDDINNLIAYLLTLR